MKCWLCEREMKKLVDCDWYCICGGQYKRIDNHFVFLDQNDNVVSKPVYNHDTISEEK